MQVDELDLGDDYEIPKISEKERRVLELLFNFLSNRNGLSFKTIRKFMPEHYNNPNLESDQRKLRRDISTLKSQGITIKYYPNEKNEELHLYKLIQSPFSEKVKFNKEELKSLSAILALEMSSNYSPDLLSACQKIFHKNLEYFPSVKFKDLEVNEFKQEIENEKSLFLELLESVKDNNPIEIEYLKEYPDIKKKYEIDPLLIFKRNSTDFYLIANDRKKDKIQIKRFIIPKILKISEIKKEAKATIENVRPEHLNYHALGFSNHDNEELEMKCDKDSIWKLKNFLNPHPYIENNNSIKIQTTNRNALFPFMLKESDTILSVNSKKFLNEFNKFIQDLKNKYTDK